MAKTLAERTGTVGMTATELMEAIIDNCNYLNEDEIEWINRRLGDIEHRLQEMIEFIQVACFEEREYDE